jgi:thiosulfate/3-mercaptopyruvate sulfurtransferase
MAPLPISERGYPHPELLAETDWLADRLSDPTLRVVDARTDEDYAASHIPGAVHLSGFSLGGIRPGPEMPEREAFARLVGELGIDETSPIVIYDAGERSQMAGMTAWAFLYYGHPDIRYLDGGLAKWSAEGLPVSSDHASHEPRTFSADPVESVYWDLDQAKAAIDDDRTLFWDVRSAGEFDGTTAG